MYLFIFVLQAIVARCGSVLDLKSSMLVSTVIGSRKKVIATPNEMHDIASVVLSPTGLPSQFPQVIRLYAHYRYIVERIEIESPDSFYQIGIHVAESPAKIHRKRHAFDAGKRIFLGFLDTSLEQVELYLTRIEETELFETATSEFETAKESLLFSLQALREFSGKLSLHSFQKEQRHSFQTKYDAFKDADVMLRSSLNNVIRCRITEWAMNQPFKNFPLLLQGYTRIMLKALEAVSTAAALATTDKFPPFRTLPNILDLYTGMIFAAVDASKERVTDASYGKSHLHDWALLLNSAWDNHKISIDLASERRQLFYKTGTGDAGETAATLRSFKRDQLAVVKNLLIFRAIVDV